MLRLRLRLPPRSDCSKVLIPARLIDDSVELAQGNHELLQAGKPLPVEPLDTVALCHFPVRDPVQYAGKAAIGYLKYAALAGWARDWGFQYIAPFQALLAGGMPALERRMSADSRNYSCAVEPSPSEQSDAGDAPLRYKGGPLKFAPSRLSLLSDVLRYAETLAKELTTSSRAPPDAAKPEDVTALQQLSEEKTMLQVRLSKLEVELRGAHDVIEVQSRRLSSRTYRLLDRLHLRLANAGLSPRVIANGVFWLLRIK